MKGDIIMSQKKVKTTSKKQKLIGTQEYVNQSTGEIVPMIVTSIEDRDFNFHKMWLNNLIMSLDEITNRKMELAFWIIENLNKENQLVMTQRKIAEKSGISYKTVCDTMRLLQQGEIPFLVKINSGAYQVNPDVIWKGSHTSRMGIVFDYSKTVCDTKRNENIDKEAVQMEIDEINVNLQQNGHNMTQQERNALKDRRTHLKSLLKSAYQNETKNDDLEQISMFDDKNTSNNVLNDTTSDFSTKDDKLLTEKKIAI